MREEARREKSGRRISDLIERETAEEEETQMLW